MYEHLMSLFSDVTENSTMIQAWLIRMMFKQLCQIQGGDLVNDCYLIYALNAKSPFQLILSRVVQWVNKHSLLFSCCIQWRIHQPYLNFQGRRTQEDKIFLSVLGASTPWPYSSLSSAKIHHWFIITFYIVPKTETFTEVYV